MEDLNTNISVEQVNPTSEPEVKSVDYTVNYSEEKSDLRVTSDEIKELKENENIPSDALYAALNDKNQAIETLKRRLANQQIQLAYYLHKNLTTETVLEFSSKCFPQLAEDNTQLSLAMYKFIRDTGGKTRLAQLREKLDEYSVRVQNALLRQEMLMRQRFGCDEDTFIQLQIEGDKSDNSTNKNFSTLSSNKEDGDNEEDKDGINYMQKAFKLAQLEISSQLLSVTMQIKRELQKFRLCSEKVIKLEEKRNILVDRVFALPVEERYGSAQIAMIEEERPATAKTESLDTTAPSMTSVTINTGTDHTEDDKLEQNSLSMAIRDMESEALHLLLMSEKQKNEFVIALEEAQLENKELRERLKDIEEAASDERVLQLQEKCFLIEKEVNEMKRSMEVEQHEKEKIIKQMAAELTSRDISQIHYREEIKSLESTITLMKEERDSLQRKLEKDSKASVEYASQHSYNRDDIASQVQSQEVDELTDLVVLQEEQIKDLLTIMSGLGIAGHSCHSKSSIAEKDEINTKSDVSIDTKENVNQMRSSQIESFDSGVFSPSTQKPENTNEEADVEKALEELLDENPNMFFDSCSDFSNMQNYEDNIRAFEDTGKVTNANHASLSATETATEFKTEDNDSETKSMRAGRPRFRNQKYLHKIESKYESPNMDYPPQKYESRVDRRQGIATTTLTVETRDKDGKSESMHAVLECSSPVDGLLEMDNASKLHLRLQCTSPQRDYSLLTINENYEENCPYCPEKNVAGDHAHKKSNTSSINLQLNKEAKLYLSKQLSKLKNQLQIEKPNDANSLTRKDVVNNLNEIYSNLFEDSVIQPLT